MTWRRLVISIASLLVLLAIVAIWLFTTNSGLRTAIALANRVAPVTISYVNLRGSLAELEADAVTVVTDSATVNLNELRLIWQPSALLQRALLIDELALDEVRVTRATPAATDDAPPAQPFDGQLPVAIELRSLTIGDVLVDAESLARDIDVVFSANDERWLITRASAQTAQGPVRLGGQLQPSDNWAHDLNVHLQSGQLGELSADAQGDAAATRLALDAPDLTATVALEIDDPGGAARWRLQSRAGNLTPLGIEGNASVSGAGDLESGSIAVDATLNGTPITFENIDFSWRDQRLTVVGKGTVMSVALTIETELDAVELRNARIEAGRYVVQPGIELARADISASGPWDALRFKLAAEGTVREQPLTARLAGVAQERTRAQLESIDIVVLGGTIKGEGDVAWAPQLVGAARLALDGINLAALDARLPTALRARAEASLADAQFDLAITQLNARVAGSAEPVTGSGSLRRTANGVLTAQLQLLAGKDNRIDIATAAGTRPAFDIDLDLASLGNFVTGAQGSARGRVSLAADLSRADGDVALAGVVVPQTLALKEARVTAGLVQGRQQLAFAAGGIEAGGVALTVLNATLSGDPAAHEFEVQAQMQGIEDVTVRGSGQWREPRWTFAVDTLRARTTAVGDIALREPLTGEVGAGVVIVSSSCLDFADFGYACGAAKIDGGRMEADARVALSAGASGLPGLLASVGLPPLELRDGLKFEGQLSANDRRIDQLSLVSDIPHLRVASAGEDAFDVTDIALNATGSGETVNVEAAFMAAGGQVRAEGVVASMFDAPTLDATIVGDLPDLEALTALVTDLDLRAGRLMLDLRARGALREPVISGNANLRDLQLQWPALGTTQTGELNVVLDERGVGTVDGTLRSGSGEARLQGSVALTAKSTSVDVRLDGSNFLISDSDELSVAASPDLTIKLDDSRLAVSGTVNIDRAFSTLAAPSGNSSVTVSQDVVVVDEQASNESAEPGLGVSIDVTSVFKTPGKIEGRGLTGEVDGRLRITQQPGGPMLANGQLSVSGEYRAFGQQLQIEQGKLIYVNTAIDNPAIDVYATRQIDDVEVGVRVRGRAASLSTDLQSTPSMPEADILHYLVLGRAPGATSSTETNQLATAALSLALRQSESGVQSLGERLGGTQLGLTQELGGLALSIGKQLSPKLFISYTVGLLEPIDVAQIRYQIDRHWSLQSEIDDETRAGIKYKIEKR